MNIVISNPEELEISSNTISSNSVLISSTTEFNSKTGEFVDEIVILSRKLTGSSWSRSNIGLSDFEIAKVKSSLAQS